MKFWTRKGLCYYAHLRVYRGPYEWTVERKLDFVSYHLIKWIHGDEKLKEMAVKVKFK